MVTLNLPKKTQALLHELAQELGVSEEQIVLDALLDRLEDWYDCKVIAERGQDDEPNIPLVEVVRELGLDLDGSRDAAE
jgi:hypothetical protein